VPANGWYRQASTGRITMELTIYHWLLIIAFIGIVIWAFGRKRKGRFEKDARIPLEEDKD
jgi:cytochrome c oxidase cbb3-type subunit IV